MEQYEWCPCWRSFTSKIKWVWTRLAQLFQKPDTDLWHIENINKWWVNKLLSKYRTTKSRLRLLQKDWFLDNIDSYTLFYFLNSLSDKDKLEAFKDSRVIKILDSHRLTQLIEVIRKEDIRLKILQLPWIIEKLEWNELGSILLRFENDDNKLYFIQIDWVIDKIRNSSEAYLLNQLLSSFKDSRAKQIAENIFYPKL